MPRRVLSLVFGVTLLGVVAVALSAASGQTRGHRAHAVPLRSAKVQAARTAEHRRRTRVEGRAGARTRRRSQAAFRSLGRRQAIRVARRAFPSTFRDMPALARARHEGFRVRRYVSSRGAVVVGPGRRRPVLLRSTLPLRARDPRRGMRPVDLTLQRRGTTAVPANPLARQQLPLRTGGTALSLPDVGVGLEPRIGRRVAGTETGGSLFFPNVRQDTDLIAAPKADGLELLYQVRSARAPRVLESEVRLPRGGRIRYASAGSPIEVVRGAQTLATVMPASAVDAQGSSVPLATSLVGRRLTFTLPKDLSRYALPILVDPFLKEDQRYWRTNGAIDFNGWNYYEAPATNMRPFQGDSIAGRGLYIAADPGYYPAGAYGEWVFLAPGATSGTYPTEASHIFKADFGYTVHAPRPDGGGSCLFEGIFSFQRYAYEQGEVWRGPQVTDPVHSGQYGLCGADFNYSYAVHCLSTCDSNGGNPAAGTPGNAAVFAMGIPVAGTSTQTGYVYMGSSLLFIADQFPPHLSVTSPTASSTGWINAGIFTATSSDYGLGVDKISATAPDWSGAYFQSACNTGVTPQGDYTDMLGQPKSGDRDHRCQQTESLSFEASALPEGEYSLSASSSDILGNTTASVSQPVKVDHSGPALTLSGELYDQAAKTLWNGLYDLNAAATDSRAGVTRVATYVDGQPLTLDGQTSDGSGDAYGAQSQSCSGGGCSLSVKDIPFDSQEYAPGPHTVRVDATDAVGNTTSQSLAIVISGQEQPCSGSAFTVYAAGAIRDGMIMNNGQRDCTVAAGSAEHQDQVTYMYGDCDSSEGDGCQPPIEVQTAPLCERHWQLYEGPTAQQDPAAPSDHADLVIRGVPAASWDNGTSLEMYTGDTTISIYGNDAQQVMDFANSVTPADSVDVPTLEQAVYEMTGQASSPTLTLPLPNLTTLARTTPCN